MKESKMNLIESFRERLPDSYIELITEKSAAFLLNHSTVCLGKRAGDQRSLSSIGRVGAVAVARALGDGFDRTDLLEGGTLVGGLGGHSFPLLSECTGILARPSATHRNRPVVTIAMN